MDWTQLIRDGGAWVVALAIGYAVLTGKLRLEREVTDRDKQIGALTTKLDTVAGKAEQVVKAEHTANQQELAELRKTNTQLVAWFMEQRQS